MEDKKLTIWMGAIALVLLIVIITIHIVRMNSSLNTTAPSQPTATWTAVPPGSVAPNEDSSSTPADVAVPQQQVAAAPESSASLRSFSISVDADAYTPDTVIVNQGDTVNLQITAVDGNHGFNQPDYGLSSTIKKGQTRTVQFQALQSGKFEFCSGACGNPGSGPIGYIIVTAK